jgi:hypothetical protein
MSLRGLYIFELQGKRDDEDVLAALGYRRPSLVGDINLSDACEREFRDAAVFHYAGKIIIIDQFKPYDHAYSPGETNTFDKRLSAISSDGTAFTAFLDDTSGTYGYSLYQQGGRRRRWAVTPGETLVDEGDALTAESAEWEADPEQRIFAIIRDLIGVAFDDLLTQDKLTGKVYRTTA